MNSFNQCRPNLGTYVEISLEGEKSDDELMELSLAAFAQIEHIERLMSFHDPESELSLINSSAHNSPVNISKEMHTVLNFALKLSQLTDGLYDLTIANILVNQGNLPEHGFENDSSANWQDIELSENSVFFKKALQIDLGGIAKGFAVDCAFNTVPDDVTTNINAGGDIRMSKWESTPIDIRVPFSENGEKLETNMLAASVATSSSYFVENDSVIISPRNKKALVDKRSVTIFTNECMVADALTKVAFLMDDSESILKHFKATGLVLNEQGSASWIN